MTAEAPQPEVVVYWRPGCGFCSALLTRLNGSNIAHAKVNIWDDPEGAAYVRSVARGNETVPTVRVGDAALVNPTYRELVAAVAGEPPRRRRGAFR